MNTQNNEHATLQYIATNATYQPANKNNKETQIQVLYSLVDPAVLKSIYASCRIYCSKEHYLYNDNWKWWSNHYQANICERERNTTKTKVSENTGKCCEKIDERDKP